MPDPIEMVDPEELDLDDPANERFAADISEFTWEGRPDYEATLERIARERAYRKRVGEEWLKRRREQQQAGGASPVPTSPVPSAIPVK